MQNLFFMWRILERKLITTVVVLSLILQNILMPFVALAETSTASGSAQSSASVSVHISFTTSPSGVTAVNSSVTQQSSAVTTTSAGAVGGQPTTGTPSTVTTTGTATADASANTAANVSIVNTPTSGSAAPVSVIQNGTSAATAQSDSAAVAQGAAPVVATATAAAESTVVQQASIVSTSTPVTVVQNADATANAVSGSVATSVSSPATAVASTTAQSSIAQSAIITASSSAPVVVTQNATATANTISESIANATRVSSVPVTADASSSAQATVIQAVVINATTSVPTIVTQNGTAEASSTAVSFATSYGATSTALSAATSTSQTIVSAASSSIVFLLNTSNAQASSSALGQSNFASALQTSSASAFTSGNGIATSSSGGSTTTPPLPACMDGVDNDGDGLTDYPADTGCASPDGTSENAKPIITLLGLVTMDLVMGTPYVEPRATVLDEEDGDISAKLLITGTVNTGTPGFYTIHYNATDSQNLAADEKIRVVVVSAVAPVNHAPVIVLNGTSTMTIMQGNTFTDPRATVFDQEDGDITSKLMISGSVNSSLVGVYTLAYNATDSQNLSATQVIRTVNVVPAGCTTCGGNTAPVITLIGQNTMSLIQGNVFNDPSATVFDQEDGTITQKLIRTGVVNVNLIGSYTLTYNATDSQNLAATPVTRIVNVVSSGGCTNCGGNTAPVITLIGQNPMSLIQGNVFNDPSATVLDQEDGNITQKLLRTGAVNVNVPGSYILTYNATDSQNLAAIPVTRVVNVTSAGCAGCGGGNNAPVITLLGQNPYNIPFGSVFADPWGTVFDQEDGTITQKLFATGVVNTGLVGSYNITYNATDSQNLAAASVTRVVNVTQVGCTGSCGGGSSNRPPVITLNGSNPMSLIQGNVFNDPWGTVSDPEEGNISQKLISSGTVNTNVLGVYSITYNATDSQNYPATPVTRVVNVVSGIGCTANCGSGGGGGGGGGGGNLALVIYNEKLTAIGATTVLITWNTNLYATSRVVYSINPVSQFGPQPFYGYDLSTVTNTVATTSHSMVIEGIPTSLTTYFRPVSEANNQVARGIELMHGAVAGESTNGVCYYLHDYLRLGLNNDPSEVTKLQSFLRIYEGFATLPVTGFFDTTTDAAVRAFQEKYRADILSPWTLPGSTGYVYFTTRKKINEIYCQRAFPLSGSQSLEISEYRTLIRNAALHGTITPLPIVGQTQTQQNLAVNDTNGKGGDTGMASSSHASSSISVTDLLATVPTVMEQSLSTSSGAFGARNRVSNALASVWESMSGNMSMQKVSLIFSILVLLLFIASVQYARRQRATELNDDAE